MEYTWSTDCIFYGFTSVISPLGYLGEQDKNINCTEITNKKREVSDLKAIQVFS